MNILYRLVFIAVFVSGLPVALGAEMLFQDAPCNPNPRTIIACRKNGGVFDFGTCQCIYKK